MSLKDRLRRSAVTVKGGAVDVVPLEKALALVDEVYRTIRQEADYIGLHRIEKLLVGEEKP